MTPDYFRQKFAKWPASHPAVVREKGRDVVYATWLIGNDYRNKSRFYGAYPAGFLDRLMALMGDVPFTRVVGGFHVQNILHVFSGSLPAGPYVRLDLHRDREAEYHGSVYDAAGIFGLRPKFGLVIADPPYTGADAVKYETPMVNRGRAMRAIADITLPGGHLAWLDTVWPMHRKDQWTTVGRITVIRSTNHRVRLLSIFERVA